MEWLLSHLKLSNNTLNCSCDININHINRTYLKIRNDNLPDDNLTDDNLTDDNLINNNLTNGYGIIFNNYVITLNHIIENIYNNEYSINKEEYDVLFNIEIYDIIILIKKNKNKDIKLFLEEFNKFYDSTLIFTIGQLIDLDENSGLKIGNTNLYLTKKNLELVELKSKLYPKIPLLLADFDFEKYKDIEINGLSGSIIHINKKIIGLLTSINENKEFEILPLHIIKLLIESAIKNEFKFYSLPVNVIQNENNTLYIQKSISTILQQKDVILKIDDKDIEENKSIYDSKLNICIPIDTYIILNGKTTLDIEYKKWSNKNTFITRTDNIRLQEIDFKETLLTYKDTEKNIELFGLKFKELSEEFLLKCMNKNILIPNLDYSYKFSDKKIIILYGYSLNIKHNIIEILNKNKIDINKKLYRLERISKKEIRTIKDVEYHNLLDKKKITLQFLNIDNSTNTITLI